MNGTVRLSCRF